MYEQNGAPVYGPESIMRAQGVYSASKLEAWEIVKRMPDPTAAVMPCIIAGPGRGGLFRPLARSILQRGIAPVPGRGDHPIHLVHVADVAGLIRAVVAARATGIWNAASPGPLSIREWVREIAQELEVRRVRHVRMPLAPIRLASRLVGYRLLAREQLLMLRHPHVLAIDESRTLRWEPNWDNASILRATIRALRADSPSPSRPSPRVADADANHCG
jgi:nucleoside-diphosphate-sugar epimerase